MAQHAFKQHWPTFVLGVLVASIFLAALVTFQVDQTEYALVMTFGRPKTELVDGRRQPKVYGPGLHLKWPYPVDRVWRHDNRLQCYELTKGQVEQNQTADDYQVVVTTFVLWKVGDPRQFMVAVRTTEGAESKLDEVVRNSRNITIGRHKLTEFINSDPTRIRIPEIEQEILDGVKTVARQKYGIDVQYIGFKLFGFPETVTAKVFDRMRAERNRKSEKYRAEGKRDAQRIRADADLKASEIIAEAASQAKAIRAEGDRIAAESYAVFQQAPDLAEFLRKLDSLRKTLSKTTTLILDTNTPPFDLLKENALDLGPLKAVPTQSLPTAQTPGDAGK
ncbi:MAG: protease modulator HflC [Kiritimatiellaeota bacterium]|nr:protease modulator HflC [Kiritimatiellota bacterium]